MAELFASVSFYMAAYMLGALMLWSGGVLLCGIALLFLLDRFTHQLSAWTRVGWEFKQWILYRHRFRRWLEDVQRREGLD